MCKRIVILAAAVLALCVPSTTEAWTFTCQLSSSCPYEASCNGDQFSVSGCTVTCYADGENGSLTQLGSANCGSGGGGGGYCDPVTLECNQG